jgi:hypothetical protein
MLQRKGGVSGKLRRRKDVQPFSEIVQLLDIDLTVLKAKSATTTSSGGLQIAL